MQNQGGIWRRWLRIEIVTANLVKMSPNHLIRMCISQGSIREASPEWSRMLAQYIGVRAWATGTGLTMLISPQPGQQLGNKLQRLGPAGINWNPGGAEVGLLGPTRTKWTLSVTTYNWEAVVAAEGNTLCHLAWQSCKRCDDGGWRNRESCVAPDYQSELSRTATR